MLLRLPQELLDHIAFYLACPVLHGLPESVTPLLLTHSILKDKLANSHALFARIFSYKFSFSAIRRRAYTPKSSEIAFQLRRSCEALREVKHRLLSPHPFAEESDRGLLPLDDIFLTLWLMCIDDDGCNRMQMECASVYQWVERYVRTQLYAETEHGWPVDNPRNSCAMWIMWFLTSKARLLAEDDHARDELINFVLPFVTVPFRYPSAFAPPNHFHLPLGASSAHDMPRNTHTYTIPTSHGDYPIYINHNRTWQPYHYDHLTPLAIPLATESAKLLYFSRRESLPFGIPPLPTTREEFNNPSLLPEIERRVSQETGPIQEDIVELNASLLGGELVQQDLSQPVSRYGKGGGAALVQPAPYRQAEDGEFIEIDESGCASRRWDNDWWRIRQCHSCLDAHEAPTMMAGFPKRGRVYEPGSLTGLWTGRMLIPSQQRLEALLLPPEPAAPVSIPIHFDEDHLGPPLTVPVYMRLREYVSYAPGRVVPSGGPRSGAPGKTGAEPADREEYDQGMQNGYFPEGTEFKPTPDGDGLRVIVPARHSSSGQVEEYVYQSLHRTARRNGNGPDPEPQPGRFHDTDNCPGCKAREDALRKVILEEQEPALEVSDDEEDGEEEEEDDEEDEDDGPVHNDSSTFD
ncbi:hypothetical protein D9758_012023 [Tetrapyrgos nigripes]|uniref:F-box domain-containing protein n=1 Tax=Tetrapyrgos nigripes TaxID=182062 RepID=A0A8H5CPF7_9AGAR|nr:hypothetical protein D9758_012023 [Tetrapyrgos nigripes]